MLIFAVLAAFLLGAMAYATETRVMTMGEVNNIVKDEANINMYPSTINYYPKLFIGEFSADSYYPDKDGSNYLWKVGAHFPFGEESDKPWVLGAYFSEEYYYNDILYYDKSPESAGKLMSLYYGRNLGEMPFGFVFSYFNNKYKNEDTLVYYNEEEALSRMEFSLGISPLDKKLDIGAGIAFTTWTDEEFRVVDGDSAMRPITKPSGNMDLMITARYWMDPMGKYVLVPHAGLLYCKQGGDFYGNVEDEWAVGVTREDKTMELELGLGMNYEASENVLLVGDVGMALENEKWTEDYVDTAATDYESEYKWMALPYFKIGIDGEVFKWLNLRCGAWTRWTRSSQKWDGQYDRSWTYVSTSTYFGAGFHWNNLVLDAAMNTDFLENGPYFISGENDYLTEQVTLKYMF